MDKKQRLFIYDRREMAILFTLGLMVAAFAFTFGVHLGKRVTQHSVPPSMSAVSQTAVLQDSVPNKQEFTEQAANAQAAADDELKQSLHQEVQKTGIKLAVPRQVDLPSGTKTKNAGATDLGREELKKTVAQPTQAAAQNSEEAAGKFTLQIGSYPSSDEVQNRMTQLKTAGLEPYVKEAQVPGLGKRFRLFIGEFSSREDAENAGRKYQSQQMIDTFLVSRSEQ